MGQHTDKRSTTRLRVGFAPIKETAGREEDRSSSGERRPAEIIVVSSSPKGVAKPRIRRQPTLATHQHETVEFVTCATYGSGSDKPKLVGAEGFEPPTPCSQSKCATRLRYAPTRDWLVFWGVPGRRSSPKLPTGREARGVPPTASASVAEQRAALAEVAEDLLEQAILVVIRRRRGAADEVEHLAVLDAVLGDALHHA